MTRFLTILAALAAGSALALVTVAAPTTADARCRGCGVAAGVIGGIAVGAAIAGAASGPYYYGSDYAYAPGYYADGPYAYDGPTYYGSDYGYYGYRRWGGSTSDYTNAERQLQGTR